MAAIIQKQCHQDWVNSEILNTNQKESQKVELLCTSCNFESSYLINCDICKSNQLCVKCNLVKHLNEFPNHNKNLFLDCQECEQTCATTFCSSCQQNLCEDCSSRIHNKGKRATHIRSQINITRDYSLKVIIIFSMAIIKNCSARPSFLEYVQHSLEEFLKKLQGYRTEEVLGIVIGDQNIDEEVCKKLFGAVIHGFQFINVSIAKIKDSYFVDRLLHKQLVESYVALVEHQSEREAFTRVLVPFEQQSHFLELNSFQSSPLAQSQHQSISMDEEEKAINHGVCSTNDTATSDKGKQSENQIRKEFLKENSKESDEPSASITQNNSFPIHQNSSLSYGNTNISQQSKKQTTYLRINQSADEGFHIINTPFDLQNNNSEILRQNYSIEQETQNLSLPHNIYSHKDISSNQINQSNVHHTHTCGMPFPVYQNFRNCQINGSQKISYAIQREMMELAEKGEIMIPKEKLVARLINILNKSKEQVEDNLRECEKNGLIHSTARLFNNQKLFDLVSLQLQFLSLQSLIWIIKSIKQDVMTPTEKLILSRIKECYALKLTPKSWDMVLQYIQHPSYMNHGHQNLEKLIVFQINDPSIGSDTTVIYIKNHQWNPEDKGKVQQDDQCWKLFVEFIEDYFKSSPPINTITPVSGNKSGQSSSHQILGESDLYSDEKKDTSNRESSDAGKGSNNLNSFQQSQQTDIKAIPGGRYGCAQFVKYCGCLELQQCSLGKLSLFTQEVINRGVIRYNRTLLVKNTLPEESSFVNDSNFSIFDPDTSIHNADKSAFMHQRQYKIKILQEALIEILTENRQGISLAQIPQWLKKKVFFHFNFQELGFPKLKNFITSIGDRVSIQLVGMNNSFAILNPSNTSSMVNNINNNILTQSSGSDLTTSNQEKEKPLFNLKAPAFNPDSLQENKKTVQNNNQNPFFYQLTETSDQNRPFTDVMIDGDDSLPSPPIVNQGNQSIKTVHQGKFPKFFISGDIQSSSVSSSSSNKVQIDRERVGTQKIRSYSKGSQKDRHLDQLLDKVLCQINEILKTQQFGLRIDELYDELNKNLGLHFDFRIFNCMDFYVFLTSYAQHMIDVECKKNTFFIYQQNHRFCPPPKNGPNLKNDKMNHLQKIPLYYSNQYPTHAYGPNNNNPGGNLYDYNTGPNTSPPNSQVPLDSNSNNYSYPYFGNPVYGLPAPPQFPPNLNPDQQAEYIYMYNQLYRPHNNQSTNVNMNPFYNMPMTQGPHSQQPQSAVPNQGNQDYYRQNQMQMQQQQQQQPAGYGKKPGNYHVNYKFGPVLQENYLHSEGGFSKGNVPITSNKNIGPYSESPIHSRSISYSGNYNQKVKGETMAKSKENIGNKRSSGNNFQANTKFNSERVEESNVEINENLQFIQELLKDDDDPISSTSFRNNNTISHDITYLHGEWSMAHLPNFNISNITFNDQSHSQYQAESQDFSITKNEKLSQSNLDYMCSHTRGFSINNEVK